MKRVLLALALVALLFNAVPVAAVSVQPYTAAETCLTLYDNFDGSGNRDTWCGTVSVVRDSDLHNNYVSRCRDSSFPNGYHNDWNDCASATRVSMLPVNYKVVYYDSINYGNPTLACYDDPNVDSGIMRLDNVGPFFGNLNDRVTSFRILGGHC